MCGRYVLTVPERQIARTFALPQPLLPFDIEPRYNIAPTQPVLAVRQPEPEADREAVLLKWGLVPPWAKDPKVGVKHINARSETAAEKPTFRHAFRKRRCLIPGNGFLRTDNASFRLQGASAATALPPDCQQQPTAAARFDIGESFRSL